MSDQQQLLQGLEALVKAINSYTESNRALIAVLINSGDYEQDDNKPSTYLDGSPA